MTEQYGAEHFPTPEETAAEMRQEALNLPPEVVAQLKALQNQINPKAVAATIILINSNGSTHMQSFYNPDGIHIEVTSEAEYLRSREETKETSD